MNSLNPTAGQQAFAELFERHKNLVYRTAYFMLGDALEAEEALQEVFVLVYKTQAEYDPARGAFTTWLHRITVNYCLGTRRKYRPPIETLADDLPARNHGGDLSWLAERDFMTQALHALSEKQRAVIVLRYFWELPYAEIAEVLGVPLGTVKSRIDLALRTLRRVLDDAEVERPAAEPQARESGI